MGGLLPGGLDFWVDVDHLVPFPLDLQVPFGDHVHHPFGELVSDDGVGDVDDPLLTHLLHLSHDWHVEHEVGVVTNLRQDALDGQAIILWNSKVAELAALHVLLGSAYQVLQKTAEV